MVSTVHPLPFERPAEGRVAICASHCGLPSRSYQVQHVMSWCHMFVRKASYSSSFMFFVPCHHSCGAAHIALPTKKMPGYLCWAPCACVRGGKWAAQRGSEKSKLHQRNICDSHCFFSNSRCLTRVCFLCFLQTVDISWFALICCAFAPATQSHFSMPSHEQAWFQRIGVAWKVPSQSLGRMSVMTAWLPAISRWNQPHFRQFSHCSLSQSQLPAETKTLRQSWLIYCKKTSFGQAICFFVVRCPPWLTWPHARSHPAIIANGLRPA